jgi:hypothetical protein
MAFSSISLIVFGLGGCAVLTVAVIAVVWVIVMERKSHSSP